MRRIIGFEFLIEPVDGAAVWVRLQGSGGKIGAGSLAAINYTERDPMERAALLGRVLEHSLGCAKHEARETGAVRVSREHDDPAQRIIQTMLIRLTPMEAAPQVTAQLGGDPVKINRGRCDEWADRMANLVGGHGLWLDTIWPDVAHCVLVLDGRFYDAEHPDGVNDLTYWAPTG